MYDRTSTDGAPQYPGDVIISWNGPNDARNPQLWSTQRKNRITALLCLSNICYTVSSTSFSPMTTAIAEEYHVADATASLPTTLFALGAGLGALFWGPLSERFGRRVPILTGFAGFVLFQIPTGAAANYLTLLLSRALCGFTGTAPVIVAGGVLADLWDPERRAAAIMMFTMATFVGLVLGPILGSSVVSSHITWRWTVWLTMILSAGCGGLVVWGVAETYQPVILQKRARQIRLRDRNWALHSLLDEERLSFTEIGRKYLLRPVSLLKETILLLITVYMSFVYGLLYVFCDAYPYSFYWVRRWPSVALATVPLLSIALGVGIGGALIREADGRFHTHARVYARTSGTLLSSSALHNRLAEGRLPPMLVGGIILSFGLFWFAVTSNASTTWVAPCAAGVFIGCGILMIFLQGLRYILDVYHDCVNSATAVSISFRCVAAAIAPLFSPPMFHNLGVPWSMATLGFISVLLIPVPVCFYKWGKSIRARDSRLLPEQVHPAFRSNVVPPSVPLRIDSGPLEIPPAVWRRSRSSSPSLGSTAKELGVVSMV